MDDPIWISKELVLAIHSRQLAEHGGADGVRDEGLLESASPAPRNSFAYEDPTPTFAALAAALCFGIARNHAFIDGNKRTAAVVCETFLVLNGQTLEATDAELHPIFLSLAAGSLTEADLAAWLTAHTAAQPNERANAPSHLQGSGDFPAVMLVPGDVPRFVMEQLTG